MIALIDNKHEIDLSKPIDISIPLSNTDENPIAWYIEKPEIEPVKVGDWIGKVSEGSSTNFNNIFFNPHGHGTHTECLGHITREFYSINQCLNQFFFTAELISIEPENIDGDLIITKQQIVQTLQYNVSTKDIVKALQCNVSTMQLVQTLQSNVSTTKALIIRTLPNSESKKQKKYSNTNPPYLSQEAAIFLREIGVEHLLIDLPSVDKEKDEGKLLAHKAFWNVKDVNVLNKDARLNCTITEMIFVENEIQDGNYLLNLQIASFENDASPSKPILYKII